VDLLCWYSVTAFSVLPPAMAESVNMVIRIGIAIVEVRDLTILIVRILSPLIFLNS